MEPYSVIVQAGPDEILHAREPRDLVFGFLREWPSVGEVLAALPDMEGAAEAAGTLESWGIRAFVGDPYNVCRRLLAAQERLAPQAFSVRLLAIWKHADLRYVDRLVAAMREDPADLAAPPRDFDVTLAADVASLEAVGRIAGIGGDSQEALRARFNPWGYMEMHPESFRVRYVEPAPRYGDDRVREILGDGRCHPENEFFGRRYQGSRYHFLAPRVPAGQRILDIACGSGFGSALLAERAEVVVGVDYLEEYVAKARERYPEGPRLRFLAGDGQRFLYEGGDGWFDLAVSLHTLEHVPDDRAMLAALHRNLRPGGRLILEVPILMDRPLGVPINPYHLREYRREDILGLVREAGFRIDERVGGCREFYGREDQARDSLQIWATRTD